MNQGIFYMRLPRVGTRIVSVIDTRSQLGAYEICTFIAPWQYR
jgi:hypothetical protein